jgi:hypothetical protein
MFPAPPTIALSRLQIRYNSGMKTSQNKICLDDFGVMCIPENTL